MALFLAKRLLAGVAVVLLTAVFSYGGWRYLRGVLPENHPWLQKTVGDLKRFFLHGDFGTACSYLNGSKSRPCPAVRDLFARGWQADLWMIAGSIGLGAAAGLAGGFWSASHPRSRRSRALEALAMIGLCAPPFVFGYGLLMLFDPAFGRIRLPLFFDMDAYQQPYQNPWDFVRAMLVPWLVAGAPVFAIVMRIARGAIVDAAEEDFMRTAIAKGLPTERAVSLHGRPLAYPAVFSWLGTSAALIITNVFITETVFNVPGFLEHMRRGFKPPAAPEFPDFALLQAEAVWIAVLIVVLAILADIVVLTRDPRVRRVRRASVS